MWKNLEIMEDIEQAAAEEKASLLKKEKVILDFVGVELEMKQGDSVLKKARKRIEKFKRGKK